MESNLQAFLLEHLMQDPESVFRIEGAALVNLHNCALGERVEPLVKSECRKTPALNLLEFLYPNAERYTASLTRDQAKTMSLQLPKYISQHTPLNGRQCHAVGAAVNGIANHTGLNPTDAPFLTWALEGFTTWPEHLRGSVYWNLGKLSDGAAYGENGARTLSAAAHACSCTLADVPYGLSDDFDHPVFLDCLKNFKKIPGNAAKQFLDNGHLIKDSAALKCVGRVICDAPVAADSMGEELLQVFTQQLKLTQSPIADKCKAVEHVAGLAKSIKHGSLPAAFESYISQVDIKDSGWKLKLQKVVDQIKDPNSNLSKLFTPKVKREVKKDYILIRDKEGKVVFQKFEARQIGKSKIPTSKPLAAPVPSQPDMLKFDTSSSENSKIVSGFAAQNMLEITPQQPEKGKLTAKPKLKFLNKLIPSSSVGSFMRSLNGDLTTEVVEAVAFEVDI